MAFEDWEKGNRRGFYNSKIGASRIFEFFSTEKIEFVQEVAFSVCSHEEQVSTIYKTLQLDTPIKLRKLKKKSSPEVMVDHPLIFLK